MAAGITETSSNGLFENEIEFNGKYATIIRHLKDDLGLFNTFREGYVTAAVIGFLNKRTETISKPEKVQPASIFPNEINKRKQDLRLLYRIMMLVQDDPNYTIEDYMNRAFRTDSGEGYEEMIKENMAIFNSYACGGLDYLDEKFGELDKIEDVVDTVYELVHGFAVDMELIEAVELPEFEPVFD